ncbi:MAG: CHAT domain-containing protein [Bacteroidetes bacterium]|nr:MAG: CHAT domain-containing protein [Bacteroidota bacterium]
MIFAVKIDFDLVLLSLIGTYLTGYIKISVNNLMILEDQYSKLLIIILISALCFCTKEIKGTSKSNTAILNHSYSVITDPGTISDPARNIEELILSLISCLSRNDTLNSRFLVKEIIRKAESEIVDNETLTKSYYYAGVYYSFVKKYYESIRFLKHSLELKERDKEYDKMYSKILYNLGVSSYGLGDFEKFVDYSLRSLEIDKKIFGETDRKLVDTYSNLVIGNIELQEYRKAIDYSNIALAITNNNLDSIPPIKYANLYCNLGVCYCRLADFSKAKIYLDKSEMIYEDNKLTLNDDYINLLNSQAIANGTLGFSEKSDKYYEKGISLAVKNSSSLAFNLINSYAIILGNAGNARKGEKLLFSALEQAKGKYGENSRSFFEILSNYAEYLREYEIDIEKSLEFYRRCIDFLKKNEQDIGLKTSVYIGYSLSLAESGESDKALYIIQSLLFPGKELRSVHERLYNPGIASIKVDKQSLRILRTKYKILWDIYKKSNDQQTLEAASNTSELIVTLLEKLRINISEEDSRLILGDKYRDSYINTIRDFNLLYSKSDDNLYLEKAFEYSEKSKVAGLLASTRELKAAQFHVPSVIADFETKLQREISLLNAWITEEATKSRIDTILINKWREQLLVTTRSRDSLVHIFEKQYPEYYAIKYNTKVTVLKDISKIIGRNRNYINYVVSDTVLYVFVANRKYQQLIALPVDSSFFDNIRQFRKLLLNPSPSENAKSAFEKYQAIGYELFKTLLEPCRQYLISDKILISPDNILSYLPFEALPLSPGAKGKVLYRNLVYVMDDFDISYTYSVTFMSESVKRGFRLSNEAVVFAPDYLKPIDIQSVLSNRQTKTGVLLDLPYAREEATFVSDITAGKLYLNNDARESTFKKEAGKFDIIHLAMHTLLNDKDPMRSTLIFSQKDSLEDGFLKTYEVYGIPLRAKMVVLSSCNTGSGILSSGEGILSLARGFIYSGSQSVVMSLWEIEDRSGTEIVKMFYENLKKGCTKSVALRKARITYLKNADQFRSHPYFWSALVVYGDNSTLYYSNYMLIAAIVVVIIILISIVLYFRKRKYS